MSNVLDKSFKRTSKFRTVVQTLMGDTDTEPLKLHQQVKHERNEQNKTQKALKKAMPGNNETERKYRA